MIFTRFWYNEKSWKAMPWQYLLSKRSLSTPQRRLGCCRRQPAGLQPTWLLGCPAKRKKPEKHHYDVHKSWRKEEGGRYIHIYIYVCLYIYIYLYVILPYPARMRKRCTIVPRTLQGTLQECRKQPVCYYTGEQERAKEKSWTSMSCQHLLANRSQILRRTTSGHERHS